MKLAGSIWIVMIGTILLNKGVIKIHILQRNDKNNNEISSSFNYINTTKIPTMSLPDNFPKLISCCNLLPDYTNYAKDFIETLDHVFASSATNVATTNSEDGDNKGEENIEMLEEYGFILKQSAPMPTRDDVTLKHAAMPNKFMHCDHDSLFCYFFH